MLQPSTLRPDGQPTPLGVLGVLGGGQLGRMFVHAAQALGFRTAVLDPDPTVLPATCPTCTCRRPTPTKPR